MFEETAEHASRLVVNSPVLSPTKFTKLIELGESNSYYAHEVISLNYPEDVGLKSALFDINKKAAAAVKARLPLGGRYSYAFAGDISSCGFRCC